MAWNKLDAEFRMYARKSLQEKLDALWKEVTERKTSQEWVQSRLRWEDWERLAPQAEAFAARELRRRRWRGKRSGVVPEGYDAKGIAAQAIAEMLSGHCRLAPGFTAERVQRELERLIRQRIRQLHMLAEARLVRSEWEVLRADEEGNRASVFGRLVDENAGLAATEEEEVRARVKEEFEGFLGGDEELKGLFRCLGEGITKPSELARRLGMEEKAAVRARKRLDRRMREYRKEKG